MRLGISCPAAAPFAVQLANAPNDVNVIMTTRRYVVRLVNRAQARASGRPGPRAITGDYRRTMSYTMRAGFTKVEGIAGTNAPQGRRLEFGFHGTDSLGRSYNQPPYPHWGPAFDEVAPQFVEALGGRVELMLRSLGRG